MITHMLSRDLSNISSSWTILFIILREKCCIYYIKYNINVGIIPRRNKNSKFQGQSQTPIFIFIVQCRVSFLNGDCFKRQQVVQPSRCCVEY